MISLCESNTYGRRYRLRNAILSLVLLGSSALGAQEKQGSLLVLEPGSDKLHLVKQTDPVYPPIAKAAHVSGQVKLQVEIGTDGHVVSAKSTGGPAMLIGAAQECVKQWLYEPVLVGGKPVKASTVVIVPFGLPAPINPNDEKIAAQFFPLDQACIKAVSSNAPTSDQAETCKKAADVADQFSVQERFIERRGVFVYTSTALRRNKQNEAALGYANKAVAVVEQGHDDGSGSSAAYGVRAQAEAQLGDLVKASQDLTKAEEFERSAIISMGGMNESFAKRQYIPILKGMLGFHAQILTALGKPEEAAVKTSEAEKL